jgi:hypothetical protein
MRAQHRGLLSEVFLIHREVVPDVRVLGDQLQ